MRKHTEIEVKISFVREGKINRNRNTDIFHNGGNKQRLTYESLSQKREREIKMGIRIYSTKEETNRD